MSTLLSDLDSIPAQGDQDFVDNILREMNGGGGGGAGAPMPPTIPPPAIGGPQHATVIQAPNPNTIAPHVMDPAPATAHMIGNSQPTVADFAQLLGSAKGALDTTAAATAAAAADTPMAYETYGGTGKVSSRRRSWMSRLVDEFRPSLLVAILVFVSSLPIVNVLFSHYLPRVVKPTGELTPIGLAIKALLAGGAFWTLQRVVVPLLT